MMEIRNQELEQQIVLNDNQRKVIYSYASKLSKESIEEVCPALLMVCLNSKRGLLKNELGRVIFHLQKNERINTLIGLEKLLDGTLRVNPEKMFEILETSEKDAQELAKNIKEVLEL